MLSALIDQQISLTCRGDGMELIINGESVTVPDHVTTVAGLISYYKIDSKVIMIELNQKILDKSSLHESTLLSDKDKIEIVHFVGGG
jgi:sulfur carrier protein